MTLSMPHPPTTAAEFESLMSEIDQRLIDTGTLPFRRPFAAIQQIMGRFGWFGNFLPDRSLCDVPGYAQDVLIAKAYKWYESTYGGRLAGPTYLGHVPVELAGDLFKMRIALIYGTVEMFIDPNLANSGSAAGSRGRPATCNLLSLVEDLPQGLASRTPEATLRKLAELYLLADSALGWRDRWPTNALFDESRNSYDGSTDSLLSRRLSDSRWASQQSVEKLLKALLTAADVAYPRNAREGHDLALLHRLLARGIECPVDPAHLTAASCPPAVRYGEVPSSLGEALAANYAVLHIHNELQRCPGIAGLLTTLANDKKK